MLSKTRKISRTIKIRNRRIKILLREDRTTLLICIGIALLFWLLVKLSKTYTLEKPVVFEFEVPEGKAFVNEPPRNATVQLEGRGWELMFDYFSEPEIVLKYNLVDNYISSLSQNQLRSDIKDKLDFENIKITETNFGGIILTLEDEATRNVPIVLRDSITYAAGYHAAQPVKLSPDSVLISGPVTAVDTVTQWLTDSLVLFDLRKSAERSVPLAESPVEIDLSLEAVKAIIEVEQLTEKSFFVPLVVKNPPEDSLRYFPETVKVTCTVGLSDYNKVNASDFSPQIDLSKVSLSEGKNTIPIRMAKQPPYAVNVQFTPRSAEFVIFKKKETSEP